MTSNFNKRKKFHTWQGGGIYWTNRPLDTFTRPPASDAQNMGSEHHFPRFREIAGDTEKETRKQRIERLIRENSVKKCEVLDCHERRHRLGRYCKRHYRNRKTSSHPTISLDFQDTELAPLEHKLDGYLDHLEANGTPIRMFMAKAAQKLVHPPSVCRTRKQLAEQGAYRKSDIASVLLANMLHKGHHHPINVVKKYLLYFLWTLEPEQAEQLGPAKNRWPIVDHLAGRYVTRHSNTPERVYKPARRRWVPVSWMGGGGHWVEPKEGEMEMFSFPKWRPTTLRAIGQEVAKAVHYEVGLTALRDLHEQDILRRINNGKND
jgi:hypothetical protein